MTTAASTENKSRLVALLVSGVVVYFLATALHPLMGNDVDKTLAATLALFAVAEESLRFLVSLAIACRRRKAALKSLLRFATNESVDRSSAEPIDWRTYDSILDHLRSSTADLPSRTLLTRAGEVIESRGTNYASISEPERQTLRDLLEHFASQHTNRGNLAEDQTD